MPRAWASRSVETARGAAREAREAGSEERSTEEVTREVAEEVAEAADGEGDGSLVRGGRQWGAAAASSSWAAVLT